ncbi:unnamed protein product [Haemonchus placei]|uniref:S_100 domain-containing protein n=1 Tax=Haemonchus placei TaxID=6290 RepID=A0A0N4WKQ8_HAEPC|nr:unnamed protein product [Haemonchus placei]
MADLRTIIKLLILARMDAREEQGVESFGRMLANAMRAGYPDCKGEQRRKFLGALTRAGAGSLVKAGDLNSNKERRTC